MVELTELSKKYFSNLETSVGDRRKKDVAPFTGGIVDFRFKINFLDTLKDHSINTGYSMDWHEDVRYQLMPLTQHWPEVITAAP